ncbi:hypothetical protein MRBLMN1_001476 [Chitinophaga ginsengisegetis]|uniref:hypothetical protein n=1 Tax=Chitinophaga ginsengisegetis TaxID=393003 RepID=UPI00342A7F40
MTDINKNDFTWQKFHAFEKENNLFDVVNKDGIFIWDIIRFDIFQGLKNRNIETVTSTEKKQATLKKVFTIIKDFLKLLRIFLRGHYKFLMLTTSRNKTAGNKYYDQNIDDVLMRLNRDALIMECFETDQQKLYYSKSTFVNTNLIRKIFSGFFKNEDFNNIIQLIENTFGTFPGMNNGRINKVLHNYKVDVFFYKFLLKRKRITAVFLTQNGIQKGLFTAAGQLDIPVIECQHGLIENAHIAYSYNRSINYKLGAIKLPDYFFSFSEYWTRSVFFPVKRIIPVGNTAFYNALIVPDGMEDHKTGIVVASANIYGRKLKDLILDFVKIDNVTTVYFKLHPNQWAERDFYRAEFSAYSNVRIITDESSIGNLLKEVAAIVVVKSTAIYEALQAQRAGIVLMEDDAFKKEDFEGLPGVYFIHNAVELKSALQLGSNPPARYTDGYFFKPFAETVFNDFLSSIKKK